MKSGVIEVKYRWSVYRQPTWEYFTKALLGLAISIKSLEKGKRELILQFSIDRAKHGDMPHINASEYQTVV